ncbi:MAG TPA: response regulator transcription factor [Pyrinomonadaceae bacterium]|nr:response regulator transcription factor [Pyrinomonadaceae bacterium]
MSRRGGDGGAASVFIIAASDVVRAGLTTLIESDARFTVAGGAADSRELLTTDRAEHPAPDVVVIDAERQTEESLDALRAIADEAWEDGDAPALVVIGDEEGEWVRDALRAGMVRALLPRGASGGEIVAAVEAVSAGLFAFGADALAALLSATPRTSDEPAAGQTSAEGPPPAGTELDALTPREREVLDMLAEGLSNKEIAWRMKISGHTVKFHVASIFAKLNVSTRTEAVTQGIRRGLIMM